MNIVYFANTLFDSLRQRPQQIASALSNANRVLYVEPPTNFITFQKDLKSNPRKELREISKNLFVLRSISTLPLKNWSKYLNNYYQNKLTEKVKSALKELQFEEIINWVTFPPQAELMNKFGESFRIYECMDEYSELERSFSGKLFEYYESMLLKESMLTVFTADKLAEGKGGLTKNYIISANAAETDYFSRAVTDFTLQSKKVFDNANPVVGYIGAIREWMDIDLVAKVVSANPNLNFMFVGPVGIDTSVLSSKKNIKFIGAVPYKELLPYIKSIDVAVVPFKLNKVIEHTNPIKIYEYIAAGKPVVVTNFPEAKKFGDLVRIGQNPEDFSRQVVAALNDNSEELKKLRMNFSQKNNWQARADQIMAEVLILKNGK